MPVTFELQGLDAAVFKLKAVFGPKTSDRTIEAMRDGMVELANAVKSQAKGRGGLTRWPAHAPRTWTTSQPGTPPARISGDLLNSVEVKSDASRRTTTLNVRVGSTLPYARVQEYGGISTFDLNKAIFNKGPQYIPERPFMRPAYNRVFGGRSGQADKIIMANVRRALDVRYFRA